MSNVAIIKCPNYTQENVDKAIEKVFKDIPIKIKPNSKVLIKSNILMAKKPEYACTTHPAMIEAVCKILVKNKCKIIKIR
jgi:uncharacterized protein (DUF362 family)